LPTLGSKLGLVLADAEGWTPEEAGTDDYPTARYSKEGYGASILVWPWKEKLDTVDALKTFAMQRSGSVEDKDPKPKKTERGWYVEVTIASKPRLLYVIEAPAKGYKAFVVEADLSAGEGEMKAT